MEGLKCHFDREPMNETPAKSCCTPSREASGLTPFVALSGTSAHGHSIEQASVPAQTFLMGDAHGDGNVLDGETPVHAVEIDAFTIDATSVTNADFAKFVAATGYQTEAETYASTAVFHLALDAKPEAILGSYQGTPWWVAVSGADWAHPFGPDTSTEGIEDHPVVHVSWNDAVAYCEWAGRALPTEAQWECAARGGLVQQRFPWGNEVGEEGWKLNIWQGEFPTENTLEDGFLTTAPVRSFEPNGYGLWQPVGNVWEWCADWFDRDYFRVSPAANPIGAQTGQARVMRGGSYLCHDSYCNRYRNAARSSNTPDSSSGNVGFRTVSRP